MAAPSTDESTQEVPIEDLGLEAGDLQGLADVEGAEDIFAPHEPAVVEDTIERPTIARGREEARREEPEEDLLSATSILKSETGTLTGLTAADQTALLDVPEIDVPEIDVSEMTGELPTIETSKLGTPREVDFPLGEEAATMSEVGTKLDLARAYIDMGDPEGARSILEEVLKEGNAGQKQEAERLVASLP
jgi:pilus assembly protein FimV